MAADITVPDEPARPMLRTSTYMQRLPSPQPPPLKRGPLPALPRYAK